jgi:hypothetical protein
VTRPLRLSHAQANFVNAVVREPGRYVLAGPVGTGKATAVRAVIAALSEERDCRILIVGSQTASTGFHIEVADLPHLELSKAWLRARSDEGPSVWPSRVFAWAPPTTISDPWAEQELSPVPWDLVVFDSDSVVNAGLHAVVDPVLRGAARRIIVLVSQPGAAEAVMDLPSFEVTRWTSPFTGWSGEEFQPPPGLFRLVTFQRDDAELRLLENVNHLRDTFEDPYIREAFISLARKAWSSPYALQSAALSIGTDLRNRRNALAHGRSAGPAGEAVSSLLQPEGLLQLTAALEALEAVTRAVDMLPIDARYEALVRLITALHASDVSPVVVFCATRATTEYVANGLSLSGLSTSALAGDAGGDWSGAGLSSDPGHVVVALDVATKGLEFREASRGINYDLPGDVRRMQIRWSRLGWRSAAPRFEIWTLWDEARPTSHERRALEAMPYLRGI